MEYTKEYWDSRLEGCTNEKVRNAIKRIYSAYPSSCMPQGICDPMYIMNVLAKELGIGDGKGDFNI